MRMGVGFAMGLYGSICQFCYTVHLTGQASLSSSRLVKVGCSDFSSHRSTFLKGLGDASIQSNVVLLVCFCSQITSTVGEIGRKSHTRDWHSMS